MKPLYRKILPTPESSFTLNEFQLPYFDVPWHAHPELELIYVKQSGGMRYVGDSVEPFEAGDIALLGSHLPHCWLNAPLENCAGKNFDTDYVVVQFRYEFLGADFFLKPEMLPIQQLFREASQGILLEGEIRQHLSAEIASLFALGGLERLLKLLDILRKIAYTSEKRVLSSAGFVQSAKSGQDQFIDKVHQYVMRHFKEPITLQDLSKLTGLTPTSFCRSFKRMMKKPFFEYLKAFRVGYACRLLHETDFSISQIGYESGFNSLSLFHRQFLELKKMTPSQYRKNAGEVGKLT